MTGIPGPLPVDDPAHATDYSMPSRCARCGIEHPDETGEVVKQENDRPVRFVWERTKLLRFTVPACYECKRKLDRHTRTTVFAGWGIALLSILALFTFLPDSVFWGFKLLIAYWIWALGSRALTGFYKRFTNDPHGITWPDLCTYANGGLTFKEPTFHSEFVQLNQGR